jgi:hypothetical protein
MSVTAQKSTFCPIPVSDHDGMFASRGRELDGRRIAETQALQASGINEEN